MFFLSFRGADLLAVNADGNMPYDICEDESTLDYIESEMAKRGVTQEMIDETRAETENQMLTDLKSLADKSDDLEFRDSNGATPVSINYFSFSRFISSFTSSLRHLFMEKNMLRQNVPREKLEKCLREKEKRKRGKNIKEMSERERKREKILKR